MSAAAWIAVLSFLALLGQCPGLGDVLMPILNWFLTSPLGLTAILLLALRHLLLHGHAPRRQPRYA